MKFVRVLSVLCLIAICPLGVLDAVAQSVNATITGLVLDAQGAAVADAAITITSDERNIVVRTLHSNGDGHYTAPSLPIGKYTVTAEKQGFKKFEHHGVILNVNDNISVDFSLEVGASTETVSVVADQLQIEKQTATAAGLISPVEIKQIPLVRGIMNNWWL